MITRNRFFWPAVISTAVVLIGLFVTWLFFLHRVVTEPGYATVIVEKPWIFGDGGVRNEVQTTGVKWEWVTTTGLSVPTFDFKVDESFDDLPTKKQSFIDFSSFIKIRITDPVRLVKEFKYNNADGQAWWYWYEQSIKEQYRTIVRNVSRQHVMEDILSNPKTIQDMETAIRTEMDKLIKEINIPIVIVDLSLGKASPNKAVMEEIDETARQQQRVKSEAERLQAENSRKAAEEARASADNAYRLKMNLSTSEFVALESVKRYSEACKYQTAHCIITTGQVPLSVNTAK